PPLASCKPTGVSLAAGTRIAIAMDSGGVGNALAGELRGMGVEVVSIEEAIAGTAVQGVFWLPALDPEGDLRDMDLAQWREALRDPGAVEIGYQRGVRWTIGLEERPVADGRPGMALDRNTVFLITGAAGSIVSAITSDLAAASGGTFYLLDVAPEPVRGDAD